MELQWNQGIHLQITAEWSDCESLHCAAWPRNPCTARTLHCSLNTLPLPGCAHSLLAVIQIWIAWHDLLRDSKVSPSIPTVKSSSSLQCIPCLALASCRSPFMFWNYRRFPLLKFHLGLALRKLQPFELPCACAAWMVFLRGHQAVGERGSTIEIL